MEKSIRDSQKNVLRLNDIVLYRKWGWKIVEINPKFVKLEGVNANGNFVRFDVVPKAIVLVNRD